MNLLDKNFKNCYIIKEGGFIALISVLIIGAVGLVIVTSLISLGIGSSQTFFSFEQTNKAMSFADACAEESLLKIREENDFIGVGNILFDEGICFYEVEDIGGENRNIFIEGEVGIIKKRIKIVVSEINPKIIITSWQEVGDY